MWPAEWRVFLYCGGGLPREAIRRGRRSIRSSAALGAFEIDEGCEEGEVEIFALLLDFVFFPIA